MMSAVRERRVAFGAAVAAISPSRLPAHPGHYRSLVRCALDATPLLGARTGVAAFVSGLLEGLAGRSDIEAFGYALSWRGRTMLREVLPEGVTSGWSVPAGLATRLWRVSSAISAELILDVDGGVDVVHGTNFVVPPARHAKRVVTVHDLTCVRYPEMCSPASRRYPDLVRRAVAEGAWVHTPSAYVAAEVCAEFGASPDRVRAIPHGVIGGGGDGERGRTMAGVDDYVLAVGTIEPRKDLATLVRAFDAIAAEHPAVGLVIAGADGWGMGPFEAAVGKASHRDRITRTGYVSDEDRADLLAGASVFAFPSVYEGFGLPPLEAFAAGVPVVATTAGAIPEICGDGALLVPVGDVDAFAAALRSVLEAPADLIARGYQRVQAFTWDRAVDGMVGLYAACAA
jgi:glycosyltransferase involved in cell wall biosynthesis